MPTLAEQEELIYKCTWEWTTQNSVNGYKVTGPNGKSIFLPAAGFYEGSSLGYVSNGYYWSSTPYDHDVYHGSTRSTYYIYFDNGNYTVLSRGERNHGFPVRSVSE